MSILAAGAAAAASLLVLAHRRRKDFECKPCDVADDLEMKTPPRRTAGTPRKALLGDDDEHIGMSSDPAAPHKRDCYIGWDDVRHPCALHSPQAVLTTAAACAALTSVTLRSCLAVLHVGGSAIRLPVEGS